METSPQRHQKDFTLLDAGGNAIQSIRYGDDKLDEYEQELKKCRSWDRGSGKQQGKVSKLLKNYNDRLEKLLKKRDAL
ncbi:MAG: hypothetical protein ABEK17_03180 [Candidatus Aenigmatarchaeota archaeon]